MTAEKKWNQEKFCIFRISNKIFTNKEDKRKYIFIAVINEFSVASLKYSVVVLLKVLLKFNLFFVLLTHKVYS